MYETEANSATESMEQIPPTGITAFAGLRDKVLTRTVLSWSEHCTECAWPTCYSTCDLYHPREDGRCRRFIDGMVRIDCPESVNGYLLKIRFKQWGKLWTPGSLNLRSIHEAARIEHRDYRVGTVLYQIPLPASVKSMVIGKRYSLKKRLAVRTVKTRRSPTTFLLECYNPADCEIPLSISIRSFSKEQIIPFQRLVSLAPGFHLVRIPFEEISSIVNLDSPFGIELIPNGTDQETTLYFGLMEFVQEVAVPQAKTGKVKCVVWDLDNTLWDGVLVEDGAAALRLKPGIVSVIESLDRRGILQSIASKNNHDQAVEVLEQLHIDHFFLYPQISWSPKGDAIRAIARELNVGVDALLFVDDSEFELQQVRSSCPGVRVLDAKGYTSLLDMPECQVTVTAEGMDRRQMYQVEKSRKEVATTFKEDYKAFLKHCQITLTVTSLNSENLQRVHELTQRTNQMNFSGNRYSRDLLEEILRTPYLDTCVLACEDKFGSYGIVGFAIIDSREQRMTDLMFSCRIQSKRVEHAFVAHILHRYITLTGKDFYVSYRKTPRNQPSGQVFTDLGLKEIAIVDGVTSLVFPHHAEIPDEGIITILTQNDLTSTRGQL
jgi:FkbH-like protein